MEDLETSKILYMPQGAEKLMYLTQVVMSFSKLAECDSDESHHRLIVHGAPARVIGVKREIVTGGRIAERIWFDVPGKSKRYSTDPSSLAALLKGVEIECCQDKGCPCHHIARLRAALDLEKAIREEFGCTAFYRFDHIKNVPSILREGFKCRRDLLLSRVDFFDVADAELLENRKLHKLDGKALQEFVPLFLAKSTPMSWSLQSRPYRTDIVRFELSPAVLILPEIWCSDGNAAAFQTRFYRLREFQALNHVPWDDVLPDSFKYDGDQDKKRRRAAEILVYKAVPFWFINEIAVHSDNQVSALIAQLPQGYLDRVGISIRVDPHLLTNGVEYNA